MPTPSHSIYPAQSPGKIPGVIRTLIARAKGHSNPLHVVSLLGVAVDVKLRLKNVKDESLNQVDKGLKVGSLPCVLTGSKLKRLRTQSETIAFYNASILMSRTAVKLHVRVCRLTFIFVD